MTDNDLRKAVMDELEYDPSLDAAHIAVSVEGGVVTLLGHVASLAEKHHADKAAARVRGVRGVANELQVKLPHTLRESDEAIAQRALQVLAWDASIPKDRIQVHVSNGWVTLTGEVNWAYQRVIAEADVRKLHGVVMVTNQIAVRPVAPSAADVRQKIIDALKRNLAEETMTIHVQAQGSRVTLTGKVGDVRERVLAERAAWSAPGVTAMEDQLVIG